MIEKNSVSSDEADVQFGLAVRGRRGRLGITLDQLAEASGVTTGTLSKVERGLLSVSLRNALAIAKGLGCDMRELLEAPPADITRAGEHLRFVHPETGAERLALAHPSPGLELLEYRLPAGAASSHFEAHRSGTREVFHVLQGQIRVWSGSESIVLHAGDTATLAMDSEHRFANEGDTPAQLILLVASPQN